jgi:hypothetical protein
MNDIRNSIKHLEFNEKFDIQGQDIDEQDKQFIYQNYLNLPSTLILDMSTNSPRKSIIKNRNISIQRTIITEVSEELSKIGKDWNFDIFSIFDKTGQSMSIIAMQLFYSLSIEDTLHVSEDVFYTYFEKLEKVKNI